MAKLSRQAVVETLEKESYLVPVERLGKVAQVSQADSDSQESVVDAVNTQQEAMLEMTTS